ncbi:MAG: glycosyltransferase [Hyphomicrobiales bacterium]|nr:glycosyltransferase [Hyphomicrobiales bacterium]
MLRKPASDPRGDAATPEAPAATHSDAEILSSFDAYICFLAGAPIEAIAAARSAAASSGASLHETLIARGHLDPQAYCERLAQACGLSAADPEALRFAETALRRQPWRLLRDPRALPLASDGARAALCAESAAPRAVKGVAEALGPARGMIALASRRVVAASLARAQGPRLTRQAVEGLLRRRAEDSAKSGVWRWQAAAAAAAAGSAAGALIVAPREALTMLCALFSLVFFIGVALRAAAAVHAFRASPPTDHPAPPDAALPRYSVLVPLYKEARVLPQLVDALARLRYPPEKLDIHLVLESADAETIAAVAGMRLPGNIGVIVAPDSQPRTKPKALNYALQFAIGDYVAIYDAEDLPDPDQLLKAAAAFAVLPPSVACLQARLAYHNHGENWIAAQFAIEYASLFGGVLPMLDAAGLPLPLGGTSNHFRAAALRDAGAWDAFNVTEDADLGMRLHRAGYRCRTLDSTTWEEAACQPMNWLRQRSRWLKGWMQTYAVHMRRPRMLLREMGWRGFLAFQGHFGSVILSALAHPWFYALLVADAVSGALFSAPQSLLGAPFLALAAVNFAGAYLATLALGLAALRSRGLLRLAPHLTFTPFYWLMISAAAYRALYQLAVAPFHWEKTDHGLSAAPRFVP